MTVEFVQQWSQGGNTPSSTSYSFALSPSPTAGNLIIAVFSLDKGGGSNFAATGFTQLTEFGGVASSVPNGVIFYKESDGTETSIEFSWTGSEEPNAWCGEYSGADNADPFDVHNNSEEGSAIQQVPNGSDIQITTTVANTLLLAVATWDSEDNAFGGTDSWTGSDITTRRFQGYAENHFEPQIFVGEGSKRTFPR